MNTDELSTGGALGITRPTMVRDNACGGLRTLRVRLAPNLPFESIRFLRRIYHGCAMGCTWTGLGLLSLASFVMKMWFVNNALTKVWYHVGVFWYN